MRPDFQIQQGDALAVLMLLGDESVQACVTSPPYYQLRRYGVDGEIGQEKTLQEYIARLVEVFHEVRRVLRDDGSLWLNLGDAYWGGSGGGLGIKTKDLMGLPWRTAFALQDDGWYLRSDIIWQKPNCMPSSVTDRPTSCHEHIFLLTKSPRYYYDSFAIKEPAVYASDVRAGLGKVKYGKRRTGEMAEDGSKPNGQESFCSIDPSGRNKRDVWTVATKPCNWEFCRACERLFVGKERKLISFGDIGGHYKRICPCTAEDQFVDHFAAFPPKLVEPCVLASTSGKGMCPSCGTPWRRVVRRTGMVVRSGPRRGFYGSNTTDGLTGTVLEPARSEHAGWEPGCKCPDASAEPCVVLDPFCGSGTTGAVAVSHGRDFLGIDANADYVRLSRAVVTRAVEDFHNSGSRGPLQQG